MHPNQVRIGPGAVQALIADQFPAWRHEPITQLRATGTVNAVFRIGQQLSARFPLQPAPGSGDAVSRTRLWLEAEAAAARELLGRSRFRTPEPVAIGEPGAGFVLPWAVQTWVPGIVATEEDPSNSLPFAADLADFVHGVRAIDLRGRMFSGAGRGGDLRVHDDWMQTCFERSELLLDVPRLRVIWAELRDLPRTEPDLMTHGDLIPANVLVRDGRLVGVIDVGGLGPADPALDLVAAWHLLDTGPREVFREALGCDDLGWARGMAWAFEQAMGLVWYYLDSNPTMSLLGRRTLFRIGAALPG